MILSEVENSPPLEGCPKDGVVNTKNTIKTNSQNKHTLLKNTPIYFNTITDLPYNPDLKQKANTLRKARNLCEILFWKKVHKGHFYKIDFDRHPVIGNYIVDFYVKKLGLVVEIDGSSHDDKKTTYDANREKYTLKKTQYFENILEAV